MHLYLTYRQAKAAKLMLANPSAERHDWEAWDEFKQLIATLPLDTPEEHPTPVHARPRPEEQST